MYNIENYNYDNTDSMNAKEEANMVKETSAAQKIAEVIADIEAREKAIKFQQEQLAEEQAQFALTKKHFKTLYELKEERLKKGYEYLGDWEKGLRIRESRLLNDYEIARFEFEESIGHPHRVGNPDSVSNTEEDNTKAEQKPGIHIKDEDEYYQKLFGLEDLMERLCDVLHLDDPDMDFFENLYSKVVHMEEDPQYRVAVMEEIMKGV